MLLTLSILVCLGLVIKENFFPILKRKGPRLSAYLWTGLTLLFMLCLIIYPREVYQASLTGLNTWWNIVFPALLPFFVISDLLLGLGVVQFLGVVLEPVMRPLFNLPGSAAFVVAMGFSSGSPIGSVLTTQLLEKQLLTPKEGQRLLNFTNNASPLFMLGAIAVGMFNNPVLGYLLASAHYLANITIGLCQGLFSCKQVYIGGNYTSTQLIRKACSELEKHYFQNFEPFGLRISKSITKSINTLLVIGGFIIIFSVIIKIMIKLGCVGQLSNIFMLILAPFDYDQVLANAMGVGLFEMTLGCKSAALANANLKQVIPAVSFILGWSGLSIIAQVASIISTSRLSIVPFILSRIAHGTLAALYSLLLIPLFVFKQTTSVPTFTKIPEVLSFAEHLKYSSFGATVGLASLLIVAIITFIHKSIHIMRIRG